MESEDIGSYQNENDKDDGRDIGRPERRIKKLKSARELNKKEIKDYFENRATKLKVVKTTSTPGGHILDWVKIESQNPRGKIATPPPPIALPETKVFKGREVKTVKFELEHSDVERGPKGTIPILRKDLTKIRSTKSLQDYLSKHGHKTVSRSLDDKHTVEVPGDGAHDYAYTAQFGAIYGGEGNISAYDPYVEWSNEFSLAQIALARGSGSGKQTVEAGWQEYNDQYGDWVPHLFVFYTTNGYTSQGDNVGGYNRDVDGWIQYSNSIYPGALSSPNSVQGGDQYIMFIKYQFYQDNWWLNCNGNWIGYYSASLFNDGGLRWQADKVAFYGEIVDSADHQGLTRTDMGSGYWPEYEWPWAAYMSNLRFQSDTDGGMSTYNADVVWASDPDLYDLITFMNSGTTWGSYFWFGGPGG